MVTLAGALVVPGRWLAKVRLGGLSAIAGAVPVPLRATLALGTMVALLVTVGVAPGPTLSGGVSPMVANGPLTLRLLIWRVPLPLLVIVTATGALVVPTCWLPKAMLVGLRVAVAMVAVPLRLTVALGVTGSLLA